MNKLFREYYIKSNPIKKGNKQHTKGIKINRRLRRNLDKKRPFQIFYSFVNRKVVFAS